MDDEALLFGYESEDPTQIHRDTHTHTRTHKRGAEEEDEEDVPCAVEKKGEGGALASWVVTTKKKGLAADAHTHARALTPSPTLTDPAGEVEMGRMEQGEGGQGGAAAGGGGRGGKQ